VAYRYLSVIVAFTYRDKQQRKCYGNGKDAKMVTAMY
jgi:hypothetical protein